MKKTNSKLQEKYNEATNNENKKMAKFLKRRRLELGLTLEHVSDGICSTSYLSKIENCQVDVDETYFNLLFEKLDLKFENVVESRKVPIFSNVLKAYLENDKEYIQKLTNDLVIDKTYCETEVELLVIFYNLITENYKESLEGLEKLNAIRNTLLDEELDILFYLETVYNFKTYKYSDVAEKLQNLYQRDIKNEILLIAINDLALDYCFNVNDLNGYYWVKKHYPDNNITKLIKRIRVKHDLQDLVLKPVIDQDEEFEIYKEVLDGKYQDLYSYYYTLSLINRKMYDEAYHFSKDIDYDQDFLALKAIIINRIDDVDISFDFLTKLREITLVKNTSSYCFLEFFRIKLEKYSYMHLYNTLKNMVFSVPVNYQNHYLYQETLKEFLHTAYELGKYKEVVKLLKNSYINN